MSLYLSLLLLLTLFAAELAYFKLADHFNIIDKPNHRSSHTAITIRGGGIIFFVAALLDYIFLDGSFHYYIIGLFLISAVSFIDDITPLSSGVRLIIHIVATVLLFIQLQLFDMPVYLIAMAFILVIGTINAINFMDGINGLTGSYGLLFMLTLLGINRFITPFVEEKHLILPILALIVFNFFNFRTKAKCFAGDIGSVSLAFIILYFLLLLITKTHNISYLLLLLLYGLDVVTTIIFRIIRKEKISEAHRSHFYQFLANEKRFPHLAVSGIYVLIQLVVNIIFLNFAHNTLLTFSFALVCATLFVALRLYLEGHKKLFYKAV